MGISPQHKAMGDGTNEIIFPLLDRRMLTTRPVHHKHCNMLAEPFSIQSCKNTRMHLFVIQLQTMQSALFLSICESIRNFFLFALLLSSQTIWELLLLISPLTGLATGALRTINTLQSSLKRLPTSFQRRPHHPNTPSHAPPQRQPPLVHPLTSPPLIDGTGKALVID